MSTKQVTNMVQKIEEVNRTVVVCDNCGEKYEAKKNDRYYYGYEKNTEWAMIS